MFILYIQTVSIVMLMFYIVCHYHSIYPGVKRTVDCVCVGSDMFDGNQSSLARSVSGDHWGSDSEDTLFREARLDGVRIHPCRQSEALTETLSAAAPAVRGLLLMFGLHYHGVVHSPDEQLLGFVFLNIHDYLQLFTLN